MHIKDRGDPGASALAAPRRQVLACGPMKTAGRILLDSLGFAGRHWKSLLMIAGLLLIPAALVAAVAPSFAAWVGAPASLREGALAKVGAGVVEVVRFVVLILTGNALTLFIARDRVGQPLDWRGAWRLGLGRARPAITGTLASILAQIGYLVLFGLATAGAHWLGDRGGGAGVVGRVASPVLGFAGILFIATRIVVVGPVTAIERSGGFDGYERNRELLKGRFTVALGVLLPIELCHQIVLKLFVARPAGHAAATIRDVVVTVIYELIGAIASTLLYLWLRGPAAPLGAEEIGGVPAAAVASTEPGPT